MDKLIERTPKAFREKQNIDAHVHHEVIEVDLPGRRVHVEDKQNKKSRWEAFDRLLIATGSSPILPPVSGADAKGIYGLKHS
jgi:NAD(P)H-nitrite reductase large subunit